MSGLTSDDYKLAAQSVDSDRSVYRSGENPEIGDLIVRRVCPGRFGNSPNLVVEVMKGGQKIVAVKAKPVYPGTTNRKPRLEKSHLNTRTFSLIERGYDQARLLEACVFQGDEWQRIAGPPNKA